MADTDLSERQQRLLRAVCRDFVVSGDPVGSAALVRRHGFRWSSATLRQELAVLERKGLLRRPHRSAGCSPTRAGLRHYVEGLQPGTDPAPALVSAVDRSLSRLRDDPSQGMRAAVCVLSEISGCLAVTFVGNERHGKMSGVDVVPLVGARALVVLTMEGGATHVQPVELDSATEDDEADLAQRLRSLEHRLRGLCIGRTLTGAREVLLARLGEREAQVDRLLAEALRVAVSLCAISPLDPLWLQISGQTRLVQGMADAERLGQVLQLLEDDQRLAEVLGQLLPTAERGLPRARVHVGVGGLLDDAASDRDPAGAPGLSLVGCRVAMTEGSIEQTGLRGAVALLGPAQMDYAAMIPLVEYAARALAARMSA